MYVHVYVCVWMKAEGMGVRRVKVSFILCTPNICMEVVEKKKEKKNRKEKEMKEKVFQS